jgi:hypothetical protein
MKYLDMKMKKLKTYERGHFMPKNIIKIIFITLLVALSTSYAQIILNEGFDGTTFPPSGWTTYDNALDDYWINDRHGPHVAPGCAFAGKFGGNPHTRSDAWLITPRLEPTIGHNTLEFWYRGFNKNHEETLEIWISKTGINVASFTILHTVIGMKTWDYTKYTLNLSSFNNQLIYIAFRYVGSNTNRHGVFLDDIGGSGGGGTTYPIIDVGIFTILKPDTLELPGDILLEAQVKNYGTSDASFYTRCIVETITGARVVYRDSAYISNLASGNVTNRSFPMVNLNGGTYRVKYTTLLAGDVNSDNDQKTKDFRVVTNGYKDAGVSAIIQPTGETPYQSSTYPKIQVRNYSAQPEQVPAVIYIKNTALPYNVVYTNSISGQTIQPFGTMEYLASTPWTATTGIYNIIAKTTLSGDEDPTNDSIIGMIYCFTIDAGVITIYSPGQIAEPNSAVICSAEVINRTWEPKTVNVTLKIGDNYSNTKQVNFGAVEYKTVIFDTPYNANETGTFSVRCSTYLAEDGRPQNDVKTSSVFVPIRDIQPFVFIAPDEDSIYPDIFGPEVVIQNNGNYRVTWAPIRITIYKLNASDDSTLAYDNTTNINLYEYSNAIAYFSDWDPEPYGAGDYRITATTMFNPDLVPINNEITKKFYVKTRFRDIYLVSVRSPGDTVGTGYPVIPKVTIKNTGTVSLAFGVSTEITTQNGNIIYGPCISYFSNPLPPQQTAQLYFPNFTPNSNNPGGFIITSHLVDTDDDPTNDTASKNFTVINDVYRDVGVSAIVSPNSYEITPGVIPIKAKIYNNSNVNTNFNDLKVFFKITKQGRYTPTYEQIDSFELTKQGTTGDQQTITFPIWYNEVGNYVISCSTCYIGDQNSSNNVKRMNLTVTPIAQEGWRNTLNFIPWTIGVKEGGALTYVPEYGIFAFSGYKTPKFWRYTINENNWISRQQLNSNKVGKGAALVNDGLNKIYAIRGNNSKDFWMYDIENNTWTNLESVPITPKKKKVNGGAGLAYITKGDSHFVYLVKGNKTNEFYAYYIEGQEWLTKDTIPFNKTYKKLLDNGTCYTTDGLNYIYLLLKKYNELWRYDITNNVWEQKQDMINLNLTIKKVGPGSAMTYDTDNNTIYTLKGNNTYEFWKYSVDQNQWTYLTGDNFPPSNKKVKDGGALAYAEGNIYAFKGNKTAEFYKYIPRTSDLDAVNATTTNSAMTNQIGINLQNLTVTIKPNIVKDIVRVQYQNSNSQPLRVKIYSTNGALVYNDNVTPTMKNGTISIDVSNVGAGIYFLQIENTNTTFLEKIVVQK